LVWKGDQWFDSVSSARVDPATEKPGEKHSKRRMICPKPRIALQPKALNQEIGTLVTKTIGQHAKKFFFADDSFFFI